jgi:threonine dehydratase
VRLKLENLQRTGSFKLRGAVRAVAALSAEDRAAGLVAASAGNHGAAMALACRAERVAITVVVSRAAPEVKRAAIAALGANLLVDGADYDEAEGIARALAVQRGARFVSPFDDEEVIEGNGGDLARELLVQAPDLARVVVPVGGGGMIAGLARVLVPRGVEVVGVQPEVNCAMRDSLRQGRALTTYVGGATIADALAGAVCERTTRICAQHRVEVAVVSEDALRRAVAMLYHQVGTIAEASGATAVAGLMTGAVRAAPVGVTAVVVSGGNIDAELLDEIVAQRDGSLVP